MPPVLAISIGNTRVALGVFDGGTAPVAAAAAPIPGGGESEPTADFAPNLDLTDAVDAALVASVNPPAEAAVIAWAERRFGRTPLRFPAEVPFPFPIRYDPPGSVGADRLADALAAFDEFGGPCIVIDAGTAITVDVVAEDGTFLGGSILPGLRTAARSLRERTALLPEAGLDAAPTAVGRSTGEAIASGVLRGLGGAVDRLVADNSAELGGCDRVVATGGDAARLLAFCRTDAVLRPHLALAGLVAAHARFRAG